MMVNITWLVERGDVQMLCSEPKKVDTVIRTILQDGDLEIADLGLYEHVRLSLRDIDSPKKSHVQLGYIHYSAGSPESIKITRLQLL